MLDNETEPCRGGHNATRSFSANERSIKTVATSPWRDSLESTASGADTGTWPHHHGSSVAGPETETCSGGHNATGSSPPADGRGAKTVATSPWRDNLESTASGAFWHPLHAPLPPPPPRAAEPATRNAATSPLQEIPAGGDPTGERGGPSFSTEAASPPLQLPAGCEPETSTNCLRDPLPDARENTAPDLPRGVSSNCSLPRAVSSPAFARRSNPASATKQQGRASTPPLVFSTVVQRHDNRAAPAPHPALATLTTKTINRVEYSRPQFDNPPTQDDLNGRGTEMPAFFDARGDDDPRAWPQAQHRFAHAVPDGCFSSSYNEKRTKAVRTVRFSNTVAYRKHSGDWDPLQDSDDDSQEEEQGRDEQIESFKAFSARMAQTRRKKQPSESPADPPIQPTSDNEQAAIANKTPAEGEAVLETTADKQAGGGPPPGEEPHEIAHDSLKARLEMPRALFLPDNVVVEEHELVEKEECHSGQAADEEGSRKLTTGEGSKGAVSDTSKCSVEEASEVSTPDSELGELAQVPAMDDDSSSTASSEGQSLSPREIEELPLEPSGPAVDVLDDSPGGEDILSPTSLVSSVPGIRGRPNELSSGAFNSANEAVDLFESRARIANEKKSRDGESHTLNDGVGSDPENRGLAGMLLAERAIPAEEDEKPVREQSLGSCGIVEVFEGTVPPRQALEVVGGSMDGLSLPPGSGSRHQRPAREEADKPRSLFAPVKHRLGANALSSMTLSPHTCIAPFRTTSIPSNKLHSVGEPTTTTTTASSSSHHYTADQHIQWTDRTEESWGSMLNQSMQPAVLLITDDGRKRDLLPSAPLQNLRVKDMESSVNSGIQSIVECGGEMDTESESTIRCDDTIASRPASVTTAGGSESSSNYNDNDDHESVEGEERVELLVCEAKSWIVRPPRASTIAERFVTPDILRASNDRHHAHIDMQSEPPLFLNTKLLSRYMYPASKRLGTVFLSILDAGLPGSFSLLKRKHPTKIVLNSRVVDACDYEIDDAIYRQVKGKVRVGAKLVYGGACFAVSSRAVKRTVDGSRLHEGHTSAACLRALMSYCGEKSRRRYFTLRVRHPLNSRKAFETMLDEAKAAVETLKASAKQAELTRGKAAGGEEGREVTWREWYEKCMAYEQAKADLQLLSKSASVEDVWQDWLEDTDNVPGMLMGRSLQDVFAGVCITAPCHLFVSGAADTANKLTTRKHHVRLIFHTRSIAPLDYRSVLSACTQCECRELVLHLPDDDTTQFTLNLLQALAEGGWGLRCVYLCAAKPDLMTCAEETLRGATAAGLAVSAGVVVINSDPKSLAIQLSRSSRRVALSVPVSSATLVTGTLGRDWQTGRCSYYGFEQDILCTSTACILPFLAPFWQS